MVNTTMMWSNKNALQRPYANGSAEHQKINAVFADPKKLEAATAKANEIVRGSPYLAWGGFYGPYMAVYTNAAAIAVFMLTQ